MIDVLSTPGKSLGKWGDGHNDPLYPTCLKL